MIREPQYLVWLCLVVNCNHGENVGNREIRVSGYIIEELDQLSRNVITMHGLDTENLEKRICQFS